MSLHNLYMPSRLPYLNANELPNNIGPFPLPRHGLLPEVERFKPIHQAPMSTTPGSTTKPAKAVMNLHTVQCGERALKRLMISHHLWDNLVAYAEMDPHAASFNTCTPRPIGSDIPPPIGLPSAEQQVQGLDELYTWFTRHALLDEKSVTSESGVQDEIHSQALSPANSWMKTRYPIRTENFSATAPWDQDQVPVNVNYPVWGRACNASRADANASDREKAGIPDFVLFMDPKADRNVCIGEGKAFWSFSHTDFADFVMDTAYNGFFDWGDDRSDKAFYAVKQVWGELIYYNSSWGFITNGKELVILVKTGEYELAVTPVHDICDDTLYKALIGLCFASIDGRKADGSDSIDLITRLCGPLTAPPPAPPGAVVKDDEDTDISVDSDDSKDETYNPNDHPSDDSMSDH